MLKPLSIAVSACLVLTGCQLFQRSQTWDKVVSTPIAPRGAGTPSRNYAEGLHRELKSAHIEHQIVTFQFRYNGRLRDDSLVERTAVIYRDDANAAYPWWIKDSTSNRPVWLPNGSTERQLRFYIGRDVQLLEPGQGGDAKEMSEPPRHHARHTASAKKKKHRR